MAEPTAPTESTDSGPQTVASPTVAPIDDIGSDSDDVLDQSFQGATAVVPLTAEGPSMAPAVVPSMAPAVTPSIAPAPAPSQVKDDLECLPVRAASVPRDDFGS